MNLLFTIAFIAPIVSANLLNRCVSNYQTDVDYFPNKLHSHHYGWGTVEYTKSYKILHYGEETIVLYQCGTPRPTHFDTKTRFFSIPLNSTTLMDTTLITYFELLGLRSTIKTFGYVDYVNSPCLQKMEVNQLHLENKTLATTELERNDIVFHYMDQTVSKMNLSSNIQFPKEMDVGVNHKLNWMHFISLFYNTELQSLRIHSEISSQYKCIKEAYPPSKKPMLVAWTSFVKVDEIIGGSSYWSITKAHYKQQITRDAGAEYLDSTETRFENHEMFLKAIENVDIIIDETFALNNEHDFIEFYKLYRINEKEESSGKYGFLKNKQVYRVDGTMNPSKSYDWYESGIVMVHVVLADLVSIVQPSYDSNYKRTFIRNLYTEKIRIHTMDDCIDPKSVLKVPIFNCPAMVKEESSGSLSLDVYMMFMIVVSLTIVLEFY